MTNAAVFASQVQLTLDNSNEQISLVIQQTTVTAYQQMIQALDPNSHVAGLSVLASILCCFFFFLLPHNI